MGDIKQLDPNIHAGVKYMRWMINRYYADEPMTRLDKALFAFASYNAGPARIARLRTMTKQRGFDRTSGSVMSKIWRQKKLAPRRSPTSVISISITSPIG